MKFIIPSSSVFICVHLRSIIPDISFYGVSY